MRLENGFFALWLLAAGAGFACIWRYQTAAGQVKTSPPHWPAATEIVRVSDRDTLIMFAHPHCPCTRASVEELNRLLAQCQGTVAAHVLFFEPAGASDDWVKTDLWRTAAGIPGVTVHADIDGAQALKFGSITSGHVLLYDRSGELVFSGGITSGRGHAGDNPGEDTLIAFLKGRGASLKQTPVFGCPLRDECVRPEEQAVR